MNFFSGTVVALASCVPSLGMDLANARTVPCVVAVGYGSLVLVSVVCAAR